MVEYLIERFHYSSILTNKFDIINDVIRINTAEVVYAAVIERLKDATIPPEFLPLMKIQWFNVFTTNYDTALETALKENQRLILRTIVTGHEYDLDGIDSEILCVKLMGSLDIPYRQPGYMVLDKGDIGIANNERLSIFNRLAAHAANKSFLFFGYSFSDDLFFNVLNKLSKYIGEPKNTYYAFFSHEPDPEIRYKLSQHKVEVIVDDSSSFVSRLVDEVSKRDPKDFTKKRLLIGSEIAVLDSTNIGRFLSLYHLVLGDCVRSTTNLSLGKGTWIIWISGRSGGLFLMIGSPSSISGRNEVPLFVLPVVPRISISWEGDGYGVRNAGGISGPSGERDSLFSGSLPPSGSPWSNYSSYPFRRGRPPRTCISTTRPLSEPMTSFGGFSWRN